MDTGESSRRPILTNRPIEYAVICDGKKLINSVGYAYRTKSQSDKTIRWYCCKKYCSSVIHQSASFKTFKLKSVQHTHPPDPDILHNFKEYATAGTDRITGGNPGAKVGVKNLNTRNRHTYKHKGNTNESTKKVKSQYSTCTAGYASENQTDHPDDFLVRSEKRPQDFQLLNEDSLQNLQSNVPQSGCIADTRHEMDLTATQEWRVDKRGYKPVEYTEISNGTRRGGKKLISSDGYSYIIKFSKFKFKIWRCSVRDTGVNCKALLYQTGNMFRPGDVPHCHPPQLNSVHVVITDRSTGALVNMTHNPNLLAKPGASIETVTDTVQDSGSRVKAKSDIETLTETSQDLGVIANAEGSIGEMVEKVKDPGILVNADSAIQSLADKAWDSGITVKTEDSIKVEDGIKSEGDTEVLTDMEWYPDIIAVDEDSNESMSEKEDGPQSDCISDANSEMDFTVIQEWEVEESTDKPVEYTVVSNGTLRRGKKLISSDGYSYIIKFSKFKFKIWRCSARDTGVNCKALLYQTGEMFKPGGGTHCHPPDLSVLSTTYTTQDPDILTIADKAQDLRSPDNAESDIEALEDKSQDLDSLDDAGSTIKALVDNIQDPIILDNDEIATRSLVDKEQDPGSLDNAESVDRVQDPGILDNAESADRVQDPGILDNAESADRVQDPGILDNAESVDRVQDPGILDNAESADRVQDPGILDNAESADRVQDPGILDNAESVHRVQDPGILDNAESVDRVQDPGILDNAESADRVQDPGILDNAESVDRVQDPGILDNAESADRVQDPGILDNAESADRVQDPGILDNAESVVRVQDPGILDNAESADRVQDPGILDNAESAIEAPTYTTQDPDILDNAESAIEAPTYTTQDPGILDNAESAIEVSTYTTQDPFILDNDESAIEAPTYKTQDPGVLDNAERAIEAPTYTTQDPDILTNAERAFEAPTYMIQDPGILTNAESAIEAPTYMYTAQDPDILTNTEDVIKELEDECVKYTVVAQCGRNKLYSSDGYTYTMKEGTLNRRNDDSQSGPSSQMEVTDKLERDVEQSEDDRELDQTLPVVTNKSVQYSVVDPGKVGRERLLASSDGYMYSPMSSSTWMTIWHCSVRNQSVECKAKVYQHGVQFEASTLTHHHPPTPGFSSLIKRFLDRPEVKYTVSEHGLKLVSSDCHTYTIECSEFLSSQTTIWGCLFRDVMCKAVVYQQGGTFVPGSMSHCHPAGLGMKTPYRIIEQQPEDTPVEYTIVEKATRKGGKKLISSDGYAFNILKVSNNKKVIWKCCFKSYTKKCSAVIHQKDETFSKGSSAHCHPGDPLILSKTKSDAEAKMETISNKSADSTVKCAQLTNLIDSVSKWHQRLRPQDPDDLCFKIDMNYLKLQDFVLDIQMGDQRHLILATKKQLEVLQHSTVVFMNRTFEMVKAPFHQLLSLNGYVQAGDTVQHVPLCFVLMSRHSKKDYVAIFKTLKAQFADGWRVERFMLDFDSAAWDALGDLFPDRQLTGCSYNLARLIFTQMTSIGLTTVYNQKGDVHYFVKKLLALPFLPAENIGDAFHHLKQSTSLPALEKIMDYLETFWMSSPHWKLSQWCVHGQLVRLAQDVERWQMRINRNHARLDFYVLLPLLRREADLITEQHQIIPQEKLRTFVCPSQWWIQEELVLLWQQYAEKQIDLSDFLSCVGNFFAPPIDRAEYLQTNNDDTTLSAMCN